MDAIISKIGIAKDGIDIGIFNISAETINSIIEKTIDTILIILIMFISIKIGNRLIKKFIDGQLKGKNKKFSMSKKKAMTIGGLLRSLLKYVVYFIGIATILSDLFKGISLTAASIGGVAIGFGTQSLVKDLINGFFILFEDQYGVGDYITIGSYSGIVDSIGIRTTAIKDFNGDLCLIPNGTVQEVVNHSKSDQWFVVDVSVSYDTDIDYALAIINETSEKFREENEEVTQPIDVWGVTQLGQSGINIRTVGYCKQMNQWAMERGLRKAIKEALDKANIEIPYNKTELIFDEKEFNKRRGNK